MFNPFYAMYPLHDPGLDGFRVYKPSTSEDQRHPFSLIHYIITNNAANAGEPYSLPHPLLCTNPEK
jgi:hypothetical protein